MTRVLAVLALLATGLVTGMVASSPAQAVATSCGYGTGGTYASTLCWLDMSGYDESQARTAAGQHMDLTLPGGYSISFDVKATTPAGWTVRAMQSVALPTLAGVPIGTTAYTGIPGKPGLYQSGGVGNATSVDKGATTISLTNIVVKDSTGTAVTGYGVAMADVEATSNFEKLSWTSTSPIDLLDVVGSATGNKTCRPNLTGLGTTTVACQTPDLGQGTGSGLTDVILATTAPSSITFTAWDTYVGNRESIAFALVTAKVTLKKAVSGRVNPSDSFDLSVTSPQGSVLGTASTGTSNTADTGAVTVLPQAGQDFTLGETPTSGTQTTLSNYDQSWDCVNTVTGTVLPSGTGTSKPLRPKAGDDITCTVTNTAKADTLSIVKHAGTPTDANGDGITDAGDTIGYTFTVTNTGAVDMGNIAVTDPKVGSVTCPTPVLAPGASELCTGDNPYVITAGDVTSGAVDNSATANGTPPGSTTPVTSTPSTTSTPTTTPAPALSLVKSADPSSAAAYTVGQLITYSFVVTNTGNVPLGAIGVDETSFGGSGAMSAVSCPASTLAVAAQETCTATYTLTQADIDAGSLTNTAVATGTPPGSGTPTPSNPSTVTVPQNPAPALTLHKTADRSTVTAAGDVVHYSFLVTNTGNVTMHNVTVDETAFSGSGPTPTVSCPTGTLAPGAAETCTASYTVTQADIDAGGLDNTATASATPPGSPTPVTTPPDSVSVNAPADPTLALVKSATPATAGGAGDVVSYSFAVTNTGNVTIDNLAIDETQFTGSGTAPIVSCPVSTLTVGGQTTCTATYTLTQADIDAGSVTNTAHASGTPPGSTTPVDSPPSTATVTAGSNPALTLDKSATPGTAGAVGDAIAYNFLVTNTGNVTMSGIAIDDSVFSGSGSLSAITCPATTLAVGASMTCTASYTLTQTDVDAGSVTNTAVVTGTPPSGPPVSSPPDTVIVDVPPAPALSLVKSADPASAGAVGDVIGYSFLVTNTGNVTIDHVAISESAFTGTGSMSIVTCLATTLAPGASTTCLASYTLTQADVDSGTVTNTATAGGTPPGSTTPVDSTPSTATVTVAPAPGLSVDKTATPATAHRVGDPITYSFLVTNTGNVTMSGISVDDSAFSGSGSLSAISCPATSLVASAQMTCTASYTLTQADVDAGSVTNTAVVTGTPPTGPPVGSPPDTVVVEVPPAPAMTIDKSASLTSPDDFVAGAAVTYRFVVTNTGNVTLADVSVDEGAFTGSGTMSAVNCPAGAASLAPGAQVTCTATYTVTQADVDAGGVTNTATGTGTPPGENPPIGSPPDTVKIPDPPAPALTVVKTASTTVLTAVGQSITYSFLITNTGNVTMSGVTAVEGSFSGTGNMSAVSCPAGAASLAPGAKVTCTATYSVTQADLDRGTLTNTATAAGTPPSGPPIVSTPDTVKVPSTRVGHLVLEKTAKVVDVDGNRVVGQGDSIRWTITVTNDGGAPVTGITVSDPTAGVVSCPSSTLSAGQTMTCTVASHTITGADAKHGSVRNVATATGTGGGRVLDSSDHATVMVQSRPGVLPDTGSPTALRLALYGGVLALLVGAFLMIGSTRRRRGQ